MATTANGTPSETTAPAPAYARPAISEKTSGGEKIAEGISKVAAATPPATPPATTPATTPATAVAELRLMNAQQEMRVGERQRIALTLISSAALNSASVRLRFDSRFVAVRGISQDNTLAAGAPVVMQSIDPSGVVTISVVPPAGVTLKTGASVLVFLDIEAIAVGESAISFEKDNVNLSSLGTQLSPQLFESKIVVK